MALRGPRPKVPFRERYRTSRAILGQSLRMLRRERDLWVFPLAAGLAMLVLVVAPAILVAIWAYGQAAAWGVAPAWQGLVVGLLVLPLAYPFSVLATLCNAALCFAAHERLEGRPGRRREAWRRAVSQLGPIARFNLIAMAVAGLFQVVGVLLDKLRIVPYLGQVAQSLGMLGWAAASFFVVPVLVVDGERRAVAALRESARLARRQWGKATAGIVTIGLALLVPAMALMLLVLGAWMAWTMAAIGSGQPRALMDSLTSFFVAMGAVLAAVLLVSLLAQAATTLYQAALFRHARTGKVSAPYDEATLVDAWAPYRAR